MASATKLPQVNAKALVKAYTGPFPGHLRPSAEECRGVKAALERLHGAIKKAEVLDSKQDGVVVKEESLRPTLTPTFLEMIKLEVKTENGSQEGPVPFTDGQPESKGVSNVKLEAADLLSGPATPSQGPYKRRKVKQENDSGAPTINVGPSEQDRDSLEMQEASATKGILDTTPHRVLRSATKGKMRSHKAEPPLTKIATGGIDRPPATPGPQAVVQKPSPGHRSVLDSLVRTILSQNTTDKNSTRAFASLKQALPTWEDVRAGGPAPLAEAIKCGGLAEIKARRILDILDSLAAKRGALELEHLRFMSDEEVKAELSQFKGVGPKTVACVLMFCLDRHEFPVDTHVWRISKRLGWVPPNADREATYMHLNQRVPDDVKYDLHCLLVGHGKRCPQCAKGGRPQKAPDGPCPLTPWIKGTGKAEK